MCMSIQNKINKAFVDIGLRPRCAIPPPPSRPIGRITCVLKFSEYYLRLPGILNDPFSCMTRRLNDPFCSDAAEKIVNVFEWSGQPPKIVPYPLGSAPPFNIWFLGPTRVFVVNGMSIGSAVIAQLTIDGI